MPECSTKVYLGVRGMNNDMYSPNINIDSENISNFSQSTPSEMSQMMMTADEVRDIMNMYSNSIESCHNEIDFYNQRVAELTKTTDRLMDQSTIAKKESEQMQKQIYENQTEIKGIETQISQKKEEYDVLNSNMDVEKAQNLVQNIEGCSEKWDIGDEGNKRNDALNKFKETIQGLKQARETISMLEAENLKLREKEVLQDYQEKICITCKTMQVPKFNHDEA